MKQPFCMSNEKILLILDLDETLIHSSSALIHQNFDFQVFDYYVYKRPYLAEFLVFCDTHFQLAVWSSASEDYVELIVEHIFPKEIKPAFVWGREKCTRIFDYADFEGISPNYEYAKILKKVKKKGFSFEKILILEDTPLKVQNAYGNAIYVKPFEGNLEDITLKNLTKYLFTLKNVNNVRKIEKRGWEKNVDIE